MLKMDSSKQQEQIALLSPAYVNTGTQPTVSQTFSEYSPGQCHLVWWEQCQTTDDKTLEKKSASFFCRFYQIIFTQKQFRCVEDEKWFFGKFTVVFFNLYSLGQRIYNVKFHVPTLPLRITRKYLFFWATSSIHKNYPSMMFEMAKSINYIKPHNIKCFQTDSYST